MSVCVVVYIVELGGEISLIVAVNDRREYRYDNDLVAGELKC